MRRREEHWAGAKPTEMLITAVRLHAAYPTGGGSNVYGRDKRSVDQIETVQPDSFVRNQNVLVIQKAERPVVAYKESPFIFSVAAKRKKSRP
jgi:hypothetical protein